MRMWKLILLLSITVLFSQEQIQVGNLIMENVPEIPEAVKARTQQYRNVRSASFRSWNPTGSGMLISTRFAETSQLHFVEKPMGIRQQITFFDEPVGGGRFCPDPQQHGFLFSKDIGGNEYYQIFYFDLKDGSHRMLTDGESRNGLGPWSNSGAQFAYTSNMGNGTDMQIYIGDLKGSEPRQVVSEPGYWVATSWSPDDSKVLVMKYISITETYLHYIDLKTGEMIELNPSEETIAYGSGAFSKDGKGIYLTSDEDTEFKHLRYYDLTTKETQLVSGHIPWDVSGFAQTDDGKHLAYLSNEDGISKIHLLRTKDFREITLPELPVGDIGGLSFKNDSRHLALAIDNPRTPGDIFVIDIKKKQLVRWTKSEVGGLNTNKFILPELIHVDSFDGLSIPAFLFKPDKPGPHPVVIYIHGGPESQYTPYFSSTFQYWINELGLAVLATNVRGSDGYGKTYLKMDNGYNRENSVYDIGAFLDWIDDNPDLNEDKVAVFGGSYGGYMVLASMTHYNDRLAAAVDVVGISNFVTFLENTKAYRRDVRRPEYGDERIPEMRAFLEKISPNNNADKITKPLFIVQGFNDPRVPVTEAEQMRDVIKANGGDVWYMVAMDEGHGFRKKVNRDYYYNAVSLFWEEFLLK